MCVSFYLIPQMMLPENMARLLAAMHESVNAAGSHHHNLNNPIDHSTQSSQSSVTSNSKGNHLQHSSHHPLNFANINTLVQQPLVSSAGSPVRSPSSVMNGGGITNSNGGNSGGANNSLSGGASLNHHLRGDGGSNGSSSNNGHLFSHKPKSRSSQGLFLFDCKLWQCGLSPCSGRVCVKVSLRRNFH